MMFITWWMAAPLRACSCIVAVGVLVPLTGSNSTEREFDRRLTGPPAGEAHAALGLRLALAHGAAVGGAAALVGRAGVDHVAAAAGAGFEADAQRRIARHGQHARVVDVGFQLGGGAFEVAALDAAVEAGRRQAGQYRQHRGHDRGFDQGDAGLAAASAGADGRG